MVKINLKKNVIPVQIGELEFEFRLTDKSIKGFESQSEKTEKNLVEAVEKYQEDEIEEAKLIDILNNELTDLYDLIFGEGAYKKIYELVPSALDNIEIFMDLMPAIRAEYDEMMDKRDKQRKKKIEEYKKRKQ